VAARGSWLYAERGWLWGAERHVLPGSGTDCDRFQADDAVCRRLALQQTGITANQAGAASLCVSSWRRLV
jgi:hypothetical protein